MIMIIFHIIIIFCVSVCVGCVLGERWCAYVSVRLCVWVGWGGGEEWVETIMITIISYCLTHLARGIHASEICGNF